MSTPSPAALARMTAVAASHLTTSCTLTRLGATVAAAVPCRLQPTGGTYAVVPGQPDMDVDTFTLRLPVGTDVRPMDLAVVGGERYSVLRADGPRTIELTQSVTVVYAGHASDGATALNLIVFLDVSRLQAAVSGTPGRTRSTIATGIPARVHPVPADVIGRESLPSQIDLTKFTVYDIALTGSPPPDVQVGDHLVDPARTNPATGQQVHYIVDSVAEYGTDHLQIRARRQFTKSST